MTKQNLTFGNIKIPVTEYASQGNAILGIRDSGKSYTATYIAERLLEANIPFVAFDPIGIWKYLRVGDKGNGYPVVVAGGRNGDLPLTPQSAPEIVRQAMIQGVPLVLDLYDMAMSKADWKSIVESSVRLLLYENGDYGLRHIFIEEAAEFVPQRVGPDQGRVYAEIEKLARMGGNALLGYTLINQRAEEVNKAVLELCDCLFLHRQKGRNSLTALSKWLDIGSSMTDSKELIQSLPMLPQGECYVWPSGVSSPERVKIPQKNTFHPDRRAITSPNAKGANFKALDVSTFVSDMSEALSKHIEEARSNDPKELKREIARLNKELAKKAADISPTMERVEVPVMKPEEYDRIKNSLDGIKDEVQTLINQGQEMFKFANLMDDAIQAIAGRVKDWDSAYVKMNKPVKTVVQDGNVFRATREIKHGEPVYLEGITAPQQRILDSLRILQEIRIYQPLRTMVAFLSNQSPRSSGFKNNLGSLRSQGCIEYVGGDRMALTTTGQGKAFTPSAPLTAYEFQQIVLRQLPMPQARILEALIEAGGQPMLRADVADQAGQSFTSSGYKNNLGALRSLGLIDYAGSDSVKALPIMFLE